MLHPIPKLGDKIAGRTIIAVRKAEEKHLAVIAAMGDDGDHDPYVAWLVNLSGDAPNANFGDYCRTLAEVSTAFALKCKRYGCHIETERLLAELEED